MKLVVLTHNGKRLLIDTDEVKNYKEIYLQEDGSSFEKENMLDDVVIEIIEPIKQKKKGRKSSKLSKKS